MTEVFPHAVGEISDQLGAEEVNSGYEGDGEDSDVTEDGDEGEDKNDQLSVGLGADEVDSGYEGDGEDSDVTEDGNEGEDKNDQPSVGSG